MNQMAQVLGIVSGGSGTTALIVDGDRPVWRGLGKAGGFERGSTGGLQESLVTAIEGCPPPDAVCAAFAGVGTPSQMQMAEDVLRHLFPSTPVRAVTDIEAALVACGNANICVLAGRGSCVCSFGDQGQMFVSGGKGHLLGDEGSAFQYGRDAFLHFLEGPPDDVSPQLLEAVRATFATKNRADALATLYDAQDPVGLLASLAPAFAEDARQGAIYALKSLRIHPGKLAHIVSMHLRQYHPFLARPKIGCQGNLWEWEVFRDAFLQQLGFWCKVEEIEVDFDVKAPVFGAAQIAGSLLR